MFGWAVERVIRVSSPYICIYKYFCQGHRLIGCCGTNWKSDRIFPVSGVVRNAGSSRSPNAHAGGHAMHLKQLGLGVALSLLSAYSAQAQPRGVDGVALTKVPRILISVGQSGDAPLV